MDVILKGLMLFEEYYGLIWFIVVFMELWYLIEKETKNEHDDNVDLYDLVSNGTKSNEP